mgnify:CR=1 FL=1
MFKRAADTEAFLKRVANHSVTPSRRGDSRHLTNEPDVGDTIDAVTREAITFEEVNNQIEFAKWEKHQLTLRLQNIKLELRETLPLHKFQPIDARRKTAAAEIARIEAHLGELKQIRRKLHDDSCRFDNKDTVAEIFKGLAKKTLPPKVYEDLMSATMQIAAVKHKKDA